jgi:hypothetical protein
VRTFGRRIWNYSLRTHICFVFSCVAWWGEWGWWWWMLLLQPRRGLKKSIRDGLPVIIYNEKLTTTSSSSTSATVLMDNQWASMKLIFLLYQAWWRTPPTYPSRFVFPLARNLAVGYQKTDWFDSQILLPYVKLPSLIDSCTFFNSNNYVCCCLLQMCSVLRRLPKERNFAATAGMQSHLP